MIVADEVRNGARGRKAWREWRDRRIVFMVFGGSGRLYPATQFVGTDAGGALLAAVVPHPTGNGRAQAYEEDLDVLGRIPHLAKADLRRLDEIMDSVEDGPSLRLVVDGDDFDSQVLHGLWVAQRRGKVPR